MCVGGSRWMGPLEGGKRGRIWPVAGRGLMPSVAKLETVITWSSADVAAGCCCRSTHENK